MSLLETDKIVALEVGPESETEIPLAIEPDATEVNEGPVVEMGLVTTEFPTEQFEAFVQDQPEQAVPQDLETLKATAEDLPLEKSLAQLAAYFKEIANDTEEQEGVSVREIVQSLAKELPALRVALSDRTEHSQPITSEMTQKFLDLLRAVGYRNPSEVLAAFVSRHDIEFLLQALRYLSRLTNADYQQEFLPTLLRKPSVTDEAMSSRIGKIVFSLLIKRPQVIEIPTAA
jgi:hypothetical protein